MDIELKNNINEIHQKFSEYGRNAKEWQRKCGLLLKDIERFEIWKKKGFLSIYIYAAKLAGMNKSQVDEALRISKKIEGKPALIAVAEKKGLYAVRAVASIATAETDQYWAKYAISMPKNELETFVRDSKNQHCSENKEKNIIMKVKPEIAAKLEKLYQGDWNELMEKFIELYEKNLNKELQMEKPKCVTGGSEHVPKNIEKYVLKRSNEKCEFPGCPKNHDHLHHTNRYASDKTHDPDQIVALCEAHHALAHRGLIDREDEPTKNWKIRKERDYRSLNWFVDRQVQQYRRG